MRDAKLDFWIANEMNVIFIGNHGVGKTAMVKEAFERNGLKWRYFSASTMDPWVDFVGVPKEHREDLESFKIIRQLDGFDPNLAREWIQSNWKMSADNAQSVLQHIRQTESQENYLKLIRPYGFHDGSIEALFFDEFNRSPKKVRNAVMELLQFKSINGEKFPNLKMVWAAVNPSDDENMAYDVEEIDPAQMDRFHVRTIVPYEPNGPYFQRTYGEQIAKSAIGWWEELSDDMKREVSPRRLDYALMMYMARGNMRDVLPTECNVSKLTNALNTGPITEKLDNLMNSKDVTRSRQFMSNENNYAAAMKYIPQSETLMEFFLPLIPKEKVGVLLSEDDRASNFIINNSGQIPLFHGACQEMLKSNTNAKLVKKIRRTLTQNKKLAQDFANNGETQPDRPFFNSQANPNDYHENLTQLKRMPIDTSGNRMKVFSRLKESMPKEMTANDALDTLSLLSQIVSCQFPSTICSKPMENLPGMANHCIAEIQRHTGLDWSGITNRYGQAFQQLLNKLKDAAMINRLYTPIETKG